ncbi:hypothetical protein AB6A40_000299 [Gnathostoma spinigerum]|uniref:DNA-directed RNA polymerase n=1 Tax=Gnathostoma spinigerum TaxID=75299 RepID=A0ABD6EBD3_9BILA
MECDVASYHVESFNFLVDHGLRLAALDVPPEKFRLANGDAVELKYTSASLGYPVLCRDVVTHDATKVYPAECRQRALTYKAPLKVSVDIRVNSIRLDFCECIIGEVPVMLNSNRCHLKGLTREELLARGEESSEKGGYFICKGTEKVIRLLVANRRNYPLAVIRKSWREKGPLFTEYAIMMRCVRENHSASLLTLHYLENGAISVAIQYRREIFYVPLMYVIKALTNMNDLCIRNRLTSARPNDSFWAGCVTAMLVQCQEDGIINQDSALITLGSRFRVAFDDRIGPWESHAEAARYLLKYCIAIHLDDEIDKFNLLCYMAQKLVTVVRGECASESPDNPQFQEAAVSGHIFLLIIRERLESILHSCRRKIESFSSRKPHTYSMSSSEFLRALGTQKNGELTHSLEYFLATGNLQTKSGLCLQQNNGFTVIAERINHLRFVSHFRAIHRGAFFNEMRTTDVRKLRPEAWGFICPVHTPDGAPCGLLNHLTASTRIVTYYPDQSLLPQLLNEYGVIKHSVMELFSYAEVRNSLNQWNLAGLLFWFQYSPKSLLRVVS